MLNIIEPIKESKILQNQRWKYEHRKTKIEEKNNKWTTNVAAILIRFIIKQCNKPNQSTHN